MAAEQPYNPFRPPDASAAAVAPPPPAGPVAPVPPQPYGYPAHPGGPAGYPPGWAAPYPPVPYPPMPRNGMGTSSLVLGVVAAALCWTFILSVVTLVLGVLAVIFGVVGLRRARRREATNGGVARGGLWTGVGSAAVSAVLTVLLFVWALAPVPVVSAAGADFLADTGDQVAFDDGLVVVADAPSVNADGGYSVRLRLANEGDEDIALDGSRLTAACDGEAVPGDGVEPEQRLTGVLRPGETTAAGHRIACPGGHAEILALDLRPGDDHETAYWELDLPSGGGAGDNGGSGDGGGGGSGGLDA
ncbi:DUF4190 domain-containing protein [Streptomyces specialis]|uniref:DUF4190 domain-containing protein n=1 Tax=Streptomyces specialis TaxID=498367 RepID=UPI00073F7516|nr:DUF4190 domain-containing protein [Streptomyces specialis]